MLQPRERKNYPWVAETVCLYHLSECDKIWFLQLSLPGALVLLHSLTEITSLICQQRGMLFCWLARGQERIWNLQCETSVSHEHQEMKITSTSPLMRIYYEIVVQEEWEVKSGIVCWWFTSTPISSSICSVIIVVSVDNFPIICKPVFSIFFFDNVFLP